WSLAIPSLQIETGMTTLKSRKIRTLFVLYPSTHRVRQVTDKTGELPRAADPRQCIDGLPVEDIDAAVIHLDTPVELLVRQRPIAGDFDLVESRGGENTGLGGIFGAGRERPRARQPGVAIGVEGGEADAPIVRIR